MKHEEEINLELDKYKKLMKELLYDELIYGVSGVYFDKKNNSYTKLTQEQILQLEINKDEAR